MHYKYGFPFAFSMLSYIIYSDLIIRKICIKNKYNVPTTKEK